MDQKLNGLHSNNHNDKSSEINGCCTLSSQKYKPEAFSPDMQIVGVLEDLDSMDLQKKLNLNCVPELCFKVSDEWWQTPEEGNHDVPAGEYEQVGPRIACRCQIIRSVSQWSAGTSQTEESIHSTYCSLIENAQHFIYIENQFFISGLSGDEVIQNRVLEALYKRIVKAYKEQKCFRVIIVIPLVPGFQGGIDDGGAATVRALMHWQYRTISREKTSILHNLNMLLGPKTQDYITFYDDRAALIGSSNINDRSLLGSRDSEIGVLIEDKEFLESSMNGEPWKAGKFSYTLRCSLWCEHLGLPAGETGQISDPMADATYRDLWIATAKENTIIYQDVFDCIPNELIHSRAALRQSMSQRKEKLGHTTIDLGIAPEELETYKNGEINLMDPNGTIEVCEGTSCFLPLRVHVSRRFKTILQ
ncbi:hypothetical protein Patl1_22329 [Pistacia atlantica]|uniref:Uncharacterized protein n=1 Tax=Pistacia atlantica TaxID=434234 RepID=A0ACC0ZZC6_9ROSI|nr:hypothetical protein Patl1_22329 [Pistacia atlantica]